MKESTASSPFDHEARLDQPRMLALLVALSHLTLVVFTQLENYFLYLRASPHSQAPLLPFLAGLGLAQWENIIVAVLLGVLTLGAVTTRAQDGFGLQ